MESRKEDKYIEKRTIQPNPRLTSHPRSLLAIITPNICTFFSTLILYQANPTRGQKIRQADFPLSAATIPASSLFILVRHPYLKYPRISRLVHQGSMGRSTSPTGNQLRRAPMEELSSARSHSFEQPPSHSQCCLP